MDELYELATIKKLDMLNLGTWYPLESKGHDPKRLLETVKLRIQLSGDFTISNDYKYFKRIVPQVERESGREITFSFEWRDINEVKFDYSHLPEPKLKTWTKKEREHLQGRRTDL